MSIGHFWWLSLAPVIIASMFVWESAFMRRDASTKYPLMHCMSEKTCFYINQEYSIFHWPEYLPLKCKETRERSNNSTDSSYFFAPKDAQFYKCYGSVFSFGALVGMLGDVMGLGTVFFIVVMYFCVQVERTGTLDSLRQRVTNINLEMGFMVVLCAALLYMLD